MIGHITRLRGMADASAAQSAREHPRAKVHSAKLAAEAQALVAGAAALEQLGPLREACALSRASFAELVDDSRSCGVWGTECPMHDAGKSYHSTTLAIAALDAALTPLAPGDDDAR